MHFAILRALPWLQNISVKPRITIEAELVPPPQPTPEPQPKIETRPQAEPEKPKPTAIQKTIIKQDVIKQASPETPKQKPEAIALPQLSTEKTTPSINENKMIETPKTQTAPAREIMGTLPATTAETPITTNSANKEPLKTENPDTTWDDETLWQAYGKNLHQLAARYKQYPMMALRRGWEGKIKVIVHFSAEGKVSSLTVKKPGEHPILDDEAIAMVKKGLNDLPAPAKLRGKAFTLVIPVDFHLDEP